MWTNPKVKTIKWSDFFEVKKNEYVVFRIIPHTSVTNNTNHRLWKSLHKMYEIYDSLPSRISRKGFKFTYREKDNIWFDVVFYQKDGEKKIEFYASTTDIYAERFKRALEDRMKVTIEEANIEQLQIPIENTTVQEVKYLHHDIFTLDPKHSEQKTPISTILTASEELQSNGDLIRYSVCNEFVNRKRWSNNASWAFEKVSKGKVPQRANMSPRKVLNTSKNVIGGFVNEVSFLINDTLQAISNSFFSSDKKHESESLVQTQTLQNEIGKKNPDPKSHNKVNEPVWKSRIRVAAHSNNKLNREMMVNHVSGAFSEIAGDNELVAKTIRFKRRKEVINELNTLQLSKRTKADADINHISSDEMAKIALQLPTAELQRKHEKELLVNKKVETDIPSVFVQETSKQTVKIDGINVSIGSNDIYRNGEKLNVNTPKQKGIPIGHSELKGQQIPINIPMGSSDSELDETFRSYAFVGAPRMGKDTLIKNMVVEGNKKHGICTFVLDAIMEDGERGLADGIRNVLPPEQVIDLDLSDEDYFVPMDMTEIIEKLGKRGKDRFAKELIDFFGDMEGMSQSRSILRTFAKASTGSIFDIKNLLEDEDYRLERIKQLREEGKELLARELDKWTSETETKVKKDKAGNITSTEEKVVFDGQKSLNSKAQAILNRLDEFLGDESLFNIFAQPANKEINFEKWIREGKVVIIRVPNRKLGSLATKTLMHWITLKIYMTKLLMKPNDGEAFIVFNEPHQFLTLGLRELMRRIILEGAKWRLSALFAFHHFGLLDYGLDEDLISGGVNFFLFGNDNKKVFQRVEEQLKPTFDVELAMQTEAHHCICILRFNRRRQNAFLIHALAPPTDRYERLDNSFLTKRHSRQYGRHWKEIEQMVLGA